VFLDRNKRKSIFFKVKVMIIENFIKKNNEFNEVSAN